MLREQSGLCPLTSGDTICVDDYTSTSAVLIRMLYMIKIKSDIIAYVGLYTVARMSCWDVCLFFFGYKNGNTEHVF